MKLTMFASLIAMTTAAAFAAAQDSQPGTAPPASPHHQETTKPAPAKAKVDPVLARANVYPFDTCAVLGKKLGSMGDPIIKVYDGREVRFCCGGCPPKFEKNLAASLKKLDEKVIADQLPLYPIKTSVVSGKALPEKPVEFVSGNRLVRLADESEKAAFAKEPAKYLADLDRAVVAAQSKDYPASLDTCPVSGEKLGGDMGKPVDIVLAGRLVRLCCSSCDTDARKDPAKLIAKVDAARKAEKGGEKPSTPAPAKPADPHSGH